MSSHSNRPEKSDSLEEQDSEWLRILHKKLDGLRFGAIQLTVHEGRVVQIDCTERTRLPQPKE